MKNLHNKLDEMMNEVVYNQISEDIKKQEEAWFNEYNKMNKIQKLAYKAKFNIDVLRDKNMSLKDRLELVILGA